MWTPSTVGYSSMEHLKETCLGCNKCGLRSGARQVVFGEGNLSAELMFVGEGPGKQEDEQGQPFVGAAGTLLDKIFEAAGIERKEVFIGNVVKCRPPNNRFPTAEEVSACKGYLEAQIGFIMPSIIVCLGALATKTLINPEARITRIRGQWFEINGIKIMPTYHPAALLRDPSKKRPVWEDFKRLAVEYSNYSNKQLTLDF